MISAERISITAEKSTKTSVLLEKPSKRTADVPCLVIGRRDIAHFTRLPVHDITELPLSLRIGKRAGHDRDLVRFS